MSAFATDFLKKIVSSLRTGRAGEGSKFVFPKETLPALRAELLAVTEGPVLVEVVDRATGFAARMLLDEDSPDVSRGIIELLEGTLPLLAQLDAAAAKRAEQNLTKAREQAQTFGQRFIRPKGPGGGGLPSE